LKSGPVVVKLNSVEIRDYILRNSSLLRKVGLSVAPDYTAKQREARKHLKEIKNLAQNDGRDAKLRGDKLFIQGRLFRYDGKAVIEVKSNLVPVKNLGPPPSARLPNYPAVIPMGHRRIDRKHRRIGNKEPYTEFSVMEHTRTT
jgi:hypothetical protein